MAPKRPRIAPICVARRWFDSHGIEPASSDNGVGAINGSFWVLFLRFSQKSGFRKRLALQGLERLSFRRFISPPPPLVATLREIARWLFYWTYATILASEQLASSGLWPIRWPIRAAKVVFCEFVQFEPLTQHSKSRRVCNTLVGSKNPAHMGSSGIPLSRVFTTGPSAAWRSSQISSGLAYVRPVAPLPWTDGQRDSPRQGTAAGLRQSRPTQHGEHSVRALPGLARRVQSGVQSGGLGEAHGVAGGARRMMVTIQPVQSG